MKAKTTIELVRPTAALESSYRGHVAEFVDRVEPLIPFPIGFDPSDFSALLKKLDDCSRGVGIPEGLAAHSTFWLVRDGTEVVGVSSLRHFLTPKLLREGGNIGYGIRPSARGQGLGTEILRRTLDRAAAIGLNEALVTCDKANVASARVILRNGGVLDSEIFLEERGVLLQRYWIRGLK
jgi:predicted acetyltransferase